MLSNTARAFARMTGRAAIARPTAVAGTRAASSSAAAADEPPLRRELSYREDPTLQRRLSYGPEIEPDVEPRFLEMVKARNSARPP